MSESASEKATIPEGYQGTVTDSNNRQDIVETGDELLNQNMKGVGEAINMQVTGGEYEVSEAQRYSNDTYTLTPQVIEEYTSLNGSLSQGQIDGIPHLSVPAARGMSVMSEFSSVEEDEDDHIEPTSGKYLFLSECPDAVVSCFLKAWKAIEQGNFPEFKQAIRHLRLPQSKSLLLDICRTINIDDTEYYMTLLAYACHQSQRKIAERLIKLKADVNFIASDVTGTPISQLLVYSLMTNTERELNIAMVDYLIQQKANLDVEIIYQGVSHNLLQLALRMNRIDIAKLLTGTGVDPLTKCKGADTIPPLFTEYFYYGSYAYIRWLFEEHLKEEESEEFAERILKEINFDQVEGTQIKSRKWKSVDRNPVHALLMTDCETMTKLLVQRRPNLLNFRDNNGETALHVAVYQRNLTAVNILLSNGADLSTLDGNTLNPIMLAIQDGHEETITSMISENPVIMKKEILPGRNVIEWALDKRYAVFFKILRDCNPHELLLPIDTYGNTIGHLVAARGDTSIFENLFPIKHIHSNGDLESDGMFASLTCVNSVKKTPLHVAIDNGNVNILKTLEDKVIELERGKASLKRSEEVATWMNTWDTLGPQLLLYACSSGSIDVVRYIITNRYIHCPADSQDNEGMTPLSCAAEAGHHDIIEFLLGITSLSVEGTGKLETSPLMLAAANGHPKCISLLLNKGASVSIVNPENGLNPLMSAIQNNHKESALLILSDKQQGLNSLRFCSKQIESGGETILSSPMRMLIEHMPDVAQYVLNRCIASNSVARPEFKRAKSVSSDHLTLETNDVDTIKKVTYNFEFLDEYKMEENAKYVSQEGNWLYCDRDKSAGDLPEEEVTTTVTEPPKYDSQSHILALMIEHKRLELLTHPLVRTFIGHKWRRGALPINIIYLSIYVIFLILLNVFAVVIPRPGPDNFICPKNVSYGSVKQSSDCEGASSLMFGLYFMSIVLILFVCGYLIVEGIQMYTLKLQYWKDWQNYFQLGTFVGCIIFLVGFGNPCWCTPDWQWQIGALAVCLAWFNFVIMLMDMPFTGVPINIFFNIVMTFLRLLFLPILLTLAFGIPFFMLLIRDHKSDNLASFNSPQEAIMKIFIQSTGEIDYESIFNEGDIIYSGMAYFLFICFVILIPVLFSNLLIGLAVGDTQEEIQKALLTRISLQVNFILDLEKRDIFRHFIRKKFKVYSDKKSNYFVSLIKRLRGTDFDTHLTIAEQSHKDNQAFIANIREPDPIDTLKQSVKTLTECVHKESEQVAVLSRQLSLIREDTLSLKSELSASMVTVNEALQKMNTKKKLFGLF